MCRSGSIYYPPVLAAPSLFHRVLPTLLSPVPESRFQDHCITLDRHDRDDNRNRTPLPRLWSLCGPRDDGESVVTMMMAEEILRKGGL
jgi:hypothetical protein